MDINHVALLLIDIQKGFDAPTYWGSSRSNPQFEDNVIAILKRFRQLRDVSGKRPLIVHVYHKSETLHSPLHPNSSGVAFQEYAQPEVLREVVISKNVNSAFIGTCLEEVLRKHEIRRLYVIGLTTDHCVSTTVRMAGNLKVTDWIDGNGDRQSGEGAFLVEDATAAYAKGGFDAEVVHAVNAESLREFATVLQTKALLEDLIRL